LLQGELGDIELVHLSREMLSCSAML